jgi:hypothetical protein
VREGEKESDRRDTGEEISKEDTMSDRVIALDQLRIGCEASTGQHRKEDLE